MVEKVAKIQGEARRRSDILTIPIMLWKKPGQRRISQTISGSGTSGNQDIFDYDTTIRRREGFAHSRIGESIGESIGELMGELMGESF